MAENREGSGASAPWSVKVFVGVGVLAVIVLVLVPLSYRWGVGHELSHAAGEWNNFGTFVGGVLGPILSTLAFLALIYTVFLQEQQLSLARLMLQRSEAAIAEQSRLSREQTATAAFFELLQLHAGIKKPLLDGDNLGRSDLRKLWDDTLKWIDGSHSKGLEISDQRAFDRMVADEFFKDQWPTLGTYLDNLFGIYRFVDSSAIDDKDTLLAVLRAQLSKDELRILFYYGLSAVGKADEPLVVKYSLFKNMDPKWLIRPVSAHDYASQAFGN